MTKHVYVFSAELVGHRGVRRTIAVRSDQTLIDLHDSLQSAFSWEDDHLYSFWLSGEFWARDGTEYTHPFALESDPFAGWDLPIAKPGRKSAARSLDRLSLRKGQRIAYLFDFGDEWRVRLTVREISADDGRLYPRLLKTVGDAPPQYPENGDEEDTVPRTVTTR